jgi:predicted metal-dependent HD superfamily phosphohydrolase
MTEASQQLLLQVRQYVVNLFNSKVSSDFVFHNLDHTKDVVKACEVLADYYKLSDEERAPLLVAAWFHDTGYSGGTAKDHEFLSQKLASAFLEGKVEPAFIAKVNRCIDSTRVPQSPASQIEMIMCDADLFHLGSASFEERNKLLRKELNLLGGKKVGKKEWQKINLRFLQQHQYFTSYGKEKLEPGKRKFIEELQRKTEKESSEKNEHLEAVIPTKVTAMPAPEAFTSPAPAVPGFERQKKEKETKVERSISTMFRIVSDNHVSLSQMADSKANIMISVNTIVMSILVSMLLGKLQFFPQFIIPTIILLGVCLSAVVFAILATRPNINQGTFTKEDIQNKKVNLLFFGNFYNMALPDYDWAMKEMMSDRDYLNSSMIKDIYYLGVVLARKYKYLRISYNIFMFGLIIAILAFGIAFVFSEQ